MGGVRELQLVRSWTHMSLADPPDDQPQSWTEHVASSSYLGAPRLAESVGHGQRASEWQTLSLTWVSSRVELFLLLHEVPGATINSQSPCVNLFSGYLPKSDLFNNLVGSWVASRRECLHAGRAGLQQRSLPH